MIVFKHILSQEEAFKIWMEDGLTKQTVDLLFYQT
jgi:hypothetical protein